MRGSSITLIFSVVVSMVPCRALFQPPRTTGVVRSADGPPLGDVWVVELGEWGGNRSQADGSFQFRSGRPTVLLFTKEGFRSQLRATTGSERPDELSVQLEVESDPRRVLARCDNREAGSSNPLRVLKLRKSSGIQVKKGGDVDFTSYAATYTRHGLAALLSSQTGPLTRGLSPTPDWTKGLSER